MVGTKQRKEEFVSGLAGTSHVEVFVLSQALVLLMCHANAARLHVLGERWAPARGVVHFLLETCSVMLPLLGMVTGLVPAEAAVCVLVALYAASVLLPLARFSYGATGVVTEAQLSGATNLCARRKVYVSLFRGGLMLYTCLCILAVDFNAFPRRFAKAETYGAGLMDVGVGGIIVASGLVSVGRRGAGGGGGDTGTIHPAVAAAAAAAAEPASLRLARGLRAALPCLVLGCVRLVSVKLLGYQEHVGEYGAHWNFFATIAAVTLLAHAAPVPPRSLAAAAAGVAALHQLALSAGLGAWALSPERGPGLLAANKEGIVSVPGYWALYLAGGALAHAMHVTAQPVARTLAHVARGERGSRGALWVWLALWAAVDAALWAVALALEALVEARSRRSCNAAFVAWSAALSLSLLLPLAAAQAAWTLSWRAPHAGSSADGEAGFTGFTRMRLQDPGDGEAAQQQQQQQQQVAERCAPWLPAAASRSMLAVFLAANVLTGLVNMSIDTLAADDWTARAVVGSYMVAVAGAVAALDAWGVVIRI
ncbi:hypothetical protein FOA52_004923 [Chlamydomonas sp. UWO 241]|nr:hypothetical protein FOA52_004923 [Chlamydomonas sp. UWO 241]